MAASHQYFNALPDSVTLTGTAVVGTTAATATLVVTLTQDRRAIYLANGSSGVIYVCRKRLDDPAATVPKEIAMVPAGGVVDRDLFANKLGYSKGDQISLYAPAAVTGPIFVAAE